MQPQALGHCFVKHLFKLKKKPAMEMIFASHRGLFSLLIFPSGFSQMRNPSQINLFCTLFPPNVLRTPALCSATG